MTIRKRTSSTRFITSQRPVRKFTVPRDSVPQARNILTLMEREPTLIDSAPNVYSRLRAAISTYDAIAKMAHDTALHKRIPRDVDTAIDNGASAQQVHMLVKQHIDEAIHHYLQSVSFIEQPSGLLEKLAYDEEGAPSLLKTLRKTKGVSYATNDIVCNSEGVPSLVETMKARRQSNDRYHGN